ncbi:hypothetical protein ACHAW5_006112 [Stephanodiscus triporus]|uniref:Uncharacterized protein n=1 Tax=Stephanodiscus triporus TaxID=2934178 RepID=A0ABD3NRL1_9STRA
MPKLQAAVPAGAPPNALLRVRLPDGNEVNVRVPEGLRPGDEFIFEVSSMGEISGSGSAASGGGNAATGPKGGVGSSSKKAEKSNKQTSKNPKKKRTHNDGGAGGASSAAGRGGVGGAAGGGGDQSQQPDNAGGVFSFITGLYNIYNQYYEILIHNNAPPPEQPLSRQGSGKGTNQKSTNSNFNNAPPVQHHQQSSLSQSVSRGVRGVHSDKPLGFMDRELSNSKDLGTALLVGAFIGLSIILGFLGGVLYSTPIQKDANGHE